MRKKFVCLLSFFCLIPASCFAGLLTNVAQANFTLLDRPLIDSIAYFAGALQGFFRIAMTLALALGVCGIAWNCFRLWFGTLQVRKACISIIGNFLIFTALVFAYPRIVNGVMDLSLRIGLSAGNGYLKVNSAFVAMREDSLRRQEAARSVLRKALAEAGPVGLSDKEFAVLASSSSMPQAELRKFLQDNEVKIYSSEEHEAAGKYQGNGGFLSGLAAAFKNAFDPSDELKAIYEARDNFNKNVKKDITEAFSEKDMGQAMITLKALDEVLSEVEVEGQDGSKVKKYLYDPFLRTKNGASTSLLSPGAMIKTAVLIADIISRQSAYIYDKEKQGWFDWTGGKNLLQTVLSLIMKLAMSLGIVVAGVFFVLQYCVCIIEYYVVSAVGMLLVPCVLFEGTREFAKKLLGLFAAYFVKIIVMSLAVFWAFSAFISMGNDIIGSNNPIGLLSFANFLFTCLLCWLVVREAPKIAQGLLSGSPSLGMGDFLQAVGTAALGAGIAARAVGTAASAPFAAGSKIAHAVKERRAERDARQFRGQILGTLGAAPGNGTGTAASTAGVNSRALYGATISFGDDAGARVKNKEGNAAFLPAPAQDASRSKSEDKAVKETAPAGTTPDAAEGLKRPPAQSLTPPAALTTARNSASSKANAEAAGLDADKPDK